MATITQDMKYHLFLIKYGVPRLWSNTGRTNSISTTGDAVMMIPLNPFCGIQENGIFMKRTMFCIKYIVPFIVIFNEKSCSGSFYKQL